MWTGGKKKSFSGILEMESDKSILIHDPSDPENVKRYKLPKTFYETASLLKHKRVSGFTWFGKIEKLDIAEQSQFSKRLPKFGQSFHNDIIRKVSIKPF